MTTATAPAEATPSAVEQEAAAMHAAFAATPEGENMATPTATPPPAEPVPSAGDTTPPTKTESSPAAKPGEVVPANSAPEPEYVHITKQEWEQANSLLRAMPEIQATLTKVQRDTAGRIGGIEGVVRQIQAATPSGEAVVLTLEDFQIDEKSKEVVQDFPDVFNAIIAGVNKALSKGKVKGTADQAAPAAHAVPATPAPAAAGTAAPPESKASDQPDPIRLEEMTALREGWETIVGLKHPTTGVTPVTPFRQWLTTQPEEYRTRVLNTDSPLILNAAIAKFEKDKPAPLAKPTVPAVPDPRRSRLEAAVPLKGDGQAPTVPGEQTEEQAMRAAYHGK